MKVIILVSVILFQSTFALTQEVEMPFWEQISFSTVLINSVQINKSINKGTGFFVNLVNGSRKFSALVTNKHVVQNSEGGIIRFTIAKNNLPVYGSFINLQLKDWKQDWIFHPDTSVDLCIMPFNNIQNKLEELGTNIFIRTIPDTFIPNDSLWKTMNIMEDIAMVGYPNGLIDTTYNLPIARRGITATAPKFDFMGLKEFAIDIPVFPGSSGSPIFLIRKPLKSRQDENGFSFGIQEEIYLIGINYSGQVYSNTSDIYINSKDKIKGMYALNKEFMNLGRAIKASQLEYFRSLLKN